MPATEASLGAATAPAQPGLKRVLSRGFAISAVIGGIIGLGVLRTPGEIAKVVTNPWAFAGLWVAGGLFVVLSTLVVGELIGLSPRSGGPYVLVRRGLGPYPGFVMGWVDWLSFVADIALKAVVVVEYAALLAPIDGVSKTGVPMVLITVFAVLQLRGARLGAGIQRLAAAFIALSVVGFTLMLVLAPSVPAVSAPAEARSGLSAWALVIASIIFTYDGWIYACYFGGEVKGGGRELALSCVRGILVVFLLYVGLMASLAFSVPLTNLAGENLALAAALEQAVSPFAATLVVACAVVILLAHQNLLFLGAPRILYALSVDRLGTERAARIGGRGNPLFAVLASWSVAMVLLLAGGFEFLLQLCVFFFVLLYVGLLTGLLILRRKEAEAERPFRAWGHPVTTVFCLVCWTAVTLFQGISEPETALYALIMIAVSLPVYMWLKRVRHLR